MHAEELIRDGLHPSEILEGYKKAAAKARACAAAAHPHSAAAPP